MAVPDLVKQQYHNQLSNPTIVKRGRRSKGDASHAFCSEAMNGRKEDYISGWKDIHKHGLKANCFVVNLAQSPIHFHTADDMFPTLLRKSYLYELVTESEILPAQHLLIQGFPVPGLVSEANSAFFPFASLLNVTSSECVSQLTDVELRSLAGNSMHWAALGAWLLFGWSSTHVV